MSDEADRARPVLQIPGRVLVPVFVAFLISAVAASVYVSVRLRPAAKIAKEQLFPLRVSIGASCQEPGGPPVDLHTRGSCTNAGTISLTATDPGPEAKAITYGVLGVHASEPVAVGRFTPGETATLPLRDEQVGVHVLVFLVSSTPVDTNELLHGLSMAVRDDIPDRLVAVEQLVTDLHSRGIDGLVQRLEFRVEPSRH
jgi:hypothetical protein